MKKENSNALIKLGIAVVVIVGMVAVIAYISLPPTQSNVKQSLTRTERCYQKLLSDEIFEQKILHPSMMYTEVEQDDDGSESFAPHSNIYNEWGKVIQSGKDATAYLSRDSTLVLRFRGGEFVIYSDECNASIRWDKLMEIAEFTDETIQRIQHEIDFERVY